MRALVDTCGWIEWLVDGALVECFAPYFGSHEALVVPTAVQFELYKWVKRERGEATALEIVALTEQCQVLPLDTAIALSAADLALAHRLSFADALIYASARQSGATLVTSDNHFEGLPEVVFFPKSQA